MSRLIFTNRFVIQKMFLLMKLVMYELPYLKYDTNRQNSKGWRLGADRHGARTPTINFQTERVMTQATMTHKPQQPELHF